MAKNQTTHPKRLTARQSQQRTQRIRQLRSMYAVALAFMDNRNTQKVREIIDIELNNLGAEMESARRARHKHYLDDPALDWEDAVKEDQKIARKLYEEWFDNLPVGALARMFW